MSNSQHLPDCMTPDGADPCLGYRELLAERDGLKRERDEARALVDRNLATMGQHTELFQRYDAREAASNAALADALGLLERWYFAAADKKLGPFTETAAFLAKHGPSP